MEELVATSSRIENHLVSIGSTVHQAIGARERVLNDISKKENTISRLRLDAEHTQGAIQILDASAAMLGADQAEFVGKLVHHGLRSVLGDRYSFEMARHTGTRGGVKAEVTDAGGTSGHPGKDFGSSLEDLTEFLLRAVVIYFSDCRKILISDEPFAHLNDLTLEKMAKFINKILVGRLNLQIIIVSHSTILGNHANKVIEVTRDENGVSHAT